MVHEIMDGISNGIRSVFGGQYPVYGDEAVSQGLNAPCFFIVLQESSESALLGPRFYQRYTFDVQFIPETPGQYALMMDVSSQLFSALSVITLSGGDMLKGFQMKMEPELDVMHFYVQYTLVLRRVEEKNEMEDLQQETGLQKG